MTIHEHRWREELERGGRDDTRKGEGERAQRCLILKKEVEEGGEEEREGGSDRNED